jgi:hypothetical protein
VAELELASAAAGAGIVAAGLAAHVRAILEAREGSRLHAAAHESATRARSCAPPRPCRATPPDGR